MTISQADRETTIANTMKMLDDITPRLCLTSRELAQVLAVHENTILNARAAGKPLPKEIRIGRTIRYPKLEVALFLLQQGGAA